MVYVEKVKKAESSPFHYLLKHTGTHCYSEAFLDHIVQKIGTDPGYLGQARESYRSRS